MTRRVPVLVGLAAALLAPHVTAARSADGGATNARETQAPNRPIALPADLEVELALSALPPHLRDAATVYVYDPAEGYRKQRVGTNGFHAIVGRDDPGIRLAPWTYDAWVPDILIPVAFADHGDDHLRTYLDLGRMRAQGVPPADAQARLREGFTTGVYEAPEASGIAYMLSPLLRAYRNAAVDDTIGTFMTPHYMFHAPGVSREQIGAGNTLEHPVMLYDRPDPHGLIVLLAGATERDAYRSAAEPMLARLCALHRPWCLER